MGSATTGAPRWLQRLRTQWRARMSAWMSRRIPPARAVTLTQRQIFIFPSRTGFFFGFVLLIMLVAAINYQNNMSFALVFLLANLFVVGILHTYSNLSGLTLRAVSAQAVFPGQRSEFRLRLERLPRRQHFALKIRFDDSDASTFSVAGDDQFLEVSLFSRAEQRGWHHPGRLLVESVYPLGLLRCWTWVDLDLKALVYPAPVATRSLPALAGEQPDGSSMPVDGNDDFFGIRDYRPGDSRKRIHWKSLAKGQSLSSKVYTAYADRSVWLDWEQFPAPNPEQRLSHLCYWALELEAAGQEYGLRIPGARIAPGMGEEQQSRVLRALALYGLEDTA